MPFASGGIGARVEVTKQESPTEKGKRNSDGKKKNSTETGTTDEVMPMAIENVILASAT